MSTRQRATTDTPQASGTKALIEGFKACSLIQYCLHLPETEKNEETDAVSIEFYQLQRT